MKAEHNKKKKTNRKRGGEKKMQGRVQDEKWDRNFVSIILNFLCPRISALLGFKICPK